VPEVVPDAEVVVLSVCGAGFGIAAVLSDAKESLLVELVCDESFFEQLIIAKTLRVKKNFFIIILFFVISKVKRLD